MKDLYKRLAREKTRYATPDAYIKEALRYFENAKSRLRETPVQYNRYLDVKPVREACGTCYLAVLLTIDGYLLRRGIEEHRLPTSTEGYWKAIRQHIPHNGKLESAFSIAYENLHRIGYYLGASDVEVVKSGFRNAKQVIDLLLRTLPKKNS